MTETDDSNEGVRIEQTFVDAEAGVDGKVIVEVDDRHGVGVEAVRAYAHEIVDAARERYSNEPEEQS